MGVLAGRLWRADDSLPEDEPQAPEQPERSLQVVEQAPGEAGHALVRDGRRMSWTRQVWAASSYAGNTGRRRFAEAAAREGGWINAFLAGRPRSVRDQRDHLRGRRWLPEGHEGGAADRIGEAFHAAIGVPGVTAGNVISALCSGMFQFAIALVITSLVTAGGCLVAGMTTSAAVTTAVIVALTPVAWTFLIGMLLAGRRAAARRMPRVTRRGGAA